MADEKQASQAITRIIDEPRPIEPANLRELHALANSAASSGFFGAKSADQALVLMMAGRDMGFSYTQALRAFQLVKGKPSLSADAMVAVCLSRPDLCEYFRPVRMTDTEAVWVAKRVGCDPVEGKFTIEDAKQADIYGDMYKKYPRRMLSARAKAFLARDLFPEILMGIYSPEELKAGAEEDVPPEKVETTVTKISNVTAIEPEAPRAHESSPATVEEKVEQKPAPDYEARAAYFTEQLKAANENDLKAIADQIKEKMAGAPAAITVKLRKTFSDRKAELTQPQQEAS